MSPGKASSLSRSSLPKPLCHSVAECLDQYFTNLNGHAPRDLYQMFLEQVEPPLLRATLRFCAGNQSQAADMLGVNRATLRKKIAQYRIDVGELLR
ncbi:MAG: Fis family transcriptional regulator [Gammaproteobacteria bacterium]|nr:Fis family transcriptional regulator [Gammaproteobacteria bacterium]